MSQEQITLRMLRDAGRFGVHTFELRRAYIGNPSERIGRLRKAGHVILSGPKERLNGAAIGVRYYLLDDATPAVETVRAA